MSHVSVILARSIQASSLAWRLLIYRAGPVGDVFEVQKNGVKPLKSQVRAQNCTGEIRERVSP